MDFILRLSVIPCAWHRVFEDSKLLVRMYGLCEGDCKGLGVQLGDREEVISLLAEVVILIPLYHFYIGQGLAHHRYLKIAHQ